MRSTFTFNGHSCDEFGIYISKKPNINRSQRKFQSASVAGRNGNIYQLQDAWDEVVVTYDIFAGGYEQGDAPSDFTDIMEWLNSADDYARLEDSYDTEHYRMAVFVDATNIEQKWYSTGQAQIKFRCKPQHFLDIPDVDVNNLRNYYMGEIVSFDGDGQNLDSLTAEIKAVQDLHGYDHPWVGGAGKNLLEVTGTSTSHNGITYTVNTDTSGNITSIIAKGTASAESVFNIKMSTTLTENCILTGCPNGGGNSTYSIQALNSSSTGVLFTDTGSGANLTAQTYGRFRIRVASGTALPTAGIEFKPMIRLATVMDDTFEPYTNICPISGWDGANVNVSGVNIWDEEWEHGSIAAASGENYNGGTSLQDRIRSKNYISVMPNTEYYFVKPTNASVNALYYYDNNQGFLQYVSFNSGGKFTTPSNAYYMRFISSQDAYHNDISLNYPSTDHDYHAYNGQTYTIDLDGTRYGGSLDVTNGVLTVTHGYINLGSIGWNTTTVGTNIPIFYSDAISDRKGGSKDLVCSNYRTIDGYHADLANNDFAIADYNGANARVAIRDSNYNNATAAGFKTAMSGVQLVYELATPQTVQLTPQDVKTLVGENNIWVDSGEVDVVTAPSIANPTNHVALPIITLEGAGVRSILHLDGRVQALPSAGTTFTYSSLSTLIPTRETLTYLVKKDTPNHPNTIIITGGARGTMTAIDDEEGKIEFNVINQEGAESWGIGIIKEVQGNSEYSISCEAYNGGQLIVMFADGSGYNSLTGEAEVSASGSGWIPLSLSFKTPTECGYILMMFIRQGQDPVTDLTQKFRKIMLNTGNTAQPFRPYEAQSVSEITINGTTLKFTEHGFSEAVIDCERENFSVDGADSNTSVSVLDQYGNLSDEYLKIDKGRNKVAYSDGIVSVMLKPRFWEL